MNNTFTAAFDTLAQTVKNTLNLISGENGALAQESAADSTLDFKGTLCELFLLMRGSDKTAIYEILDKLKNIIDSNLLSQEIRKQYLQDLLKVVLYLREPRKGKGERMVFYLCVDHLFELGSNYKVLAETCLTMVENFGYYKDLNQLYKLTTNTELQSFISKLYVDVLYKDYHSYLTENALTLAAKWAPREGSAFDSMAKVVAYNLYQKINVNTTSNVNITQCLRFYRQLLSKLNKKLNTVQTFMCQKHWADIEFKNVPSVAMTKLTKAFQDEKVNPFPKSTRVVKRVMRRGRSQVMPSANLDTGRRHEESHEDYKDRQQCRDNLFEHIKSGKKINAKVANLSDIVSNYLHLSPLDVVWEAQWESRVKEIREMVSKLEKTPTIFPLVDLSSSMSGSPMINAITLGLFTSTILDGDILEPENPFANRFMSFETNPRLVKLPRVSTFDSTKPASLKEKMEIMKQWTGSGFWGGSTYILKAITLLLDIATTNNVDPKSMPEILAIFSDMQFDQGDSTWNQTSYDQITTKFKQAGYSVPHIIFWNLRGDTRGYQVKADKPNTTMLSGYSTRMLDLFLSGNIEELKQEQNQEQNNDSEIIDYATLQKQNTLTMLEKVLSHEIFESYNEMFAKLF